MEVVTKAAKYVFSGDVFERDRNNAVAMRLRDLTEDEGSSDDENDRRRKGRKTGKKKNYVSDLESSEEEDERRRKKSRKARAVESDSDSEEESSEEDNRRKKKKAAKKKKNVPKDEEEAKKEVQSKVVDVDIDGIVRRIQNLKVDDSEYAVCYFKLLEAKPTVAQLLPSPFQHMRNVLVQQTATYPNNISIPTPRLFNCHFCAMPGCKIGTCEVVNEYIKAGRVIREGRMVLYADRTSIAWSAQGLKVSVDFRFGGPLPVLGTKEATPDMTRIQTMFISCTPAPETIVSAVVQEEENDGAPVKAFATTRSKTKEARTMPEAAPKATSVEHPSIPLPLPKKNPAYTYESKAILPEALKVVKQRILEAVIPGITVAELMSISPEL